MRWIATAVALAVLATAGRAAAQADMVSTCVARGAGSTLYTMPARDTAGFQDSVRRAETTPRPGYAAGQPWFTTKETIEFARRRLIQYGLPRFIEGHELRRVGEYQGVGIYVSQGEWRTAEVLYLPVRPGCEFQPYQAIHWGIPCSELGCPFPRQEQPPGTTCQLRGDELVWAGEAGGAPAPARAESRRWYAADRPIAFRGREFRKVGVPRELPPGSVRRIGEVDGVGVYVGPETRPEDVYGFYVPVRAGCEFHLYDDASSVYGVRGD